MSNLLVLPDLREMIAENDAAGLAQVVTELHLATIADVDSATDRATAVRRICITEADLPRLASESPG